MDIKAIKEGFIFQFVDAVNAKGEFEKGSSTGGIILKSSFDDSAKQPRWCKVVSAGSDCNYAKEGMEVLLPALRWTESATVGDQKVWKSDESQIVAVRTPGSSEFTTANDYIVFYPQDGKGRTSQVGRFIVIGALDDTQKGEVLQIGPKAFEELANSYVYYSNANFFETFEINGVDYGFIKEQDVQIYEPIEN